MPRAKPTAPRALLAWLGVAKAAILLPVLLYAAPHGARVLAWSLVAVTVLTVALNLFVITRLLPVSAGELAAACRRSASIHAASEAGEKSEFSNRLLVESFVPGDEVAVEGLLHDGELTVLAVFDKPDPLDGPFFEETIFITPSRLAAEAQALLVGEARRAASAIGLTEGPVHAELRIEGARGRQGAAWARSGTGRTGRR